MKSLLVTTAGSYQATWKVAVGSKKTSPCYVESVIYQELIMRFLHDCLSSWEPTVPRAART